MSLRSTDAKKKKFLLFLKQNRFKLVNTAHQACISLVKMYLINDVTIFSMDLCNCSQIPQDPKCLVKLKAHGQEQVGL